MGEGGRAFIRATAPGLPRSDVQQQMLPLPGTDDLRGIPSHSASLTMVKAETNASPITFTSGSDSRSRRRASSSERGSPNGRSWALPLIGSLRLQTFDHAEVAASE